MLTGIRSEKNLRSKIVLAAAIALPLVFALLALAKFTGLTDATALEHAQLARHIAAGDGFATSVLRPLTLISPTSGQSTPDLVSAPVHPILLGLAFRATKASDRIVAAFNLGLWLLTVWLVFGVARYWWDWRTAGLAAVFCACSKAGLITAAAGLPQPVMELLVFGAIAAVFSKPSQAKDGDFTLAPWQPVLAGGLCGLATLADCRLWPLAIVLGIYFFKTQERRAQALTQFVGGLLLLLLPWGLRNQLACGRPLGFYWASLMENTRQYPGETIWRLTTGPAHPVCYLLLHPWDVLRKLSAGLTLYRQAGWGLFEPVVLLLCVGALFGAPAKSFRRRLAWVVTASAVLTLLFSCLTRPDGRLLLAWLPMLGCVAAAQLVAWVHANVNGFSTANGRFRLTSLALRSLTFGGVVALVAVPAVLQFTNTYANRLGDAAAVGAVINQRVPADGVLLTDVPAYTAWQWHRPALLLCQQEADLAELEKLTGRISGVYLNPALSRFSQQELSDWWMWPACPRGVYHDLVVVPNKQMLSLLRVPPEPTIPVAAEMARLAALQKALHDNPQSTESQTQLAFGYLTLGHLEEAHQLFQEISRHDHDNVDALVGLWQTMAELRQSDGTLRLAQLVSQVDLHDPRSKPLLEEAAAHFEQIFAQQPADPWLLLNLIACRLRLGQWKEVETSYARLTKALPDTFPARLMLATLYLNHGAPAKAATECDQLVQEHPNMPAAHELAGRVWLAQNQLDAALKEYETTARLRPKWINAHVQAGQICQRLQRYDEAVKHLETALQLAPNLVSAKLTLGDIYVAQGRNTDAINLYRGILATDPNQPTALNNLAAFLAKTGQAAAALPLARQAVNLYPQNPDIRDTAGWVAFQTGNQNEALLHLWEAVRLAPQYGLAHFHLAKVHQQQGQLAEARQAFQRALECGLPAPEQQEAQAALAGG